MSLASLAQKKTGTGLAGLAGLGRTTSKADLTTIEGLEQKAREVGLGRDAAKITEAKPKLSFLQRLGKGLGAFNPAQAVSVGLENGVGAGLLEYPVSIAKGLGSAISGRDLEGERKYFSDIAEQAGIENGIAKFGLGFVGDVLLDPTTYFGGAIARGVGFVGKGVGGTALKAVGKVAPETETGLRLAGTGLKDALGRAFRFGYKASKGAKEDVLSFLSKQQKAKLGLASSNLDRLGTGVLNTAQREELALKMIAGKRAEFAQREIASGLQESAKFFEPMQNKALRLIETRQRELKLLNTELRNLEKKGLRLALKPVKGVSSVQKVSAIREKVIAERALFKGEGLSERLVDLVPEKRLFSDVPITTGARETKQLVEKLIQLPKQELEKVKRLIGTREAWKASLFDDIDSLYKEWTHFDELQQSELRLAEKIFAEKGILARETARSTDPVVQKSIESQIARSQKLGEQIGLENPYEVYFPFIKKDKLTKFLNESRGLRVGSEGYRKQFKNLLTNENLELDPAKAFFTRESQIVSDRMTRDFLSGYVKKYGKGLNEFKSADEAVKSGYQLIKEKGIFGKDLGYVQEFDAKLIRDSISPEFQSINMLAKATGFDAVTSLFKRAVTGLFAPFHVRNFVSGNIQNFEVLGKDVFNPKNIAIGQKVAYLMGKGEKIPAGSITLGGKTQKFSDVMKPFVDRFSGDTFYNADFDMALKSGAELKQAMGVFTKGRIVETAKTAGLGQEAIPFKIGRAIGQFIEHQQKATAYVTALQQGKNVDDALRLAERAGFDYRALTRFESQIMRRIIPFYSFTRKNIELQLKTLGENPQRINQVLRFFGNMGEQLSEEEKQNLPAFIQESIGVKLQDTPEGLKQYVSSFGTPIEAFTQLFGTNPVLRAISTMNPILKVPVEIGIGKDSFRQRDLKDVYDAREYKIAPQVIKDLLDIKEVQKDVLKKNDKGKLVKVGERTQYAADPVRLLIARSLFTSRGVTYLDQLFGGDIEGFVKFVKTTTGIKPQQIDIEAQKYFKEKEQKRALEDILIRTGEVRKFERTYVPKK